MIRSLFILENKVNRKEIFALFQVFKSSRVLKTSGLSEPIEKTALANTALGLGRFISIEVRNSRLGERWYRCPSKVWPDETLERGLPRPWGRERKTGGGKK